MDGHALRPLLEEAGVGPDAVEVLFGGADRGVQGGLEQDYERSLPLDEAMREEVLLAWGINGQPLPPQHGYPLRLIVPGWYGMTSVKWLRRISLLTEPFTGFQQTGSYLIHAFEGDPGTPVTRIQPRSLLLPPGIPEFESRPGSSCPAATCSPAVPGRAWPRWPGSRSAPTAAGAGGRPSWSASRPLGLGRVAVRLGGVPRHLRAVLAGHRRGRQQPMEVPWNTGGYVNNAVQRVPVTVGPALRRRGRVGLTGDSLQDIASWWQRLRRVPAPVVDATLAVALVAIAVAITVGPRQGRDPDAAAYALAR